MRGESFRKQLEKDAWFLRADQRVNSWVVDKLILELSRGSPQILTDREVHRFQGLDVPTCVRLADLLLHLQRKGEEACHQLYRALHLHAEDVYFSLPTRANRPGYTKPKKLSEFPRHRERFVLNNRGPWFFLSCFGLAAGGALMYYYSGTGTLKDGARAVLAYARLSLGRPATLLLSYAESLTLRQ